MSQCFSLPFSYFSVDSILYIKNIFLTQDHRVKKMMPCQNIVSKATWTSGSGQDHVHAEHTNATVQCWDPQACHNISRSMSMLQEICVPCQKTNTAQNLVGFYEIACNIPNRSSDWERDNVALAVLCISMETTLTPFPTPFALAWLEAIKNMCVTCFVWQWR